MDGFKGIRQSQTSPKYLHSNSTSHKWPFSAVAELIDNAYDPDVYASKLEINYESFVNQPCLTFTDDGNGLDAEEMHKMLSFGFSHKKDTSKHLSVGQYGNGFKSGSMRLGRDAIVFSSRTKTKTIGFLSQTFLEHIKAETVLVPIVSWSNNRMIASEDAEPSLRAILEHSIFKTKEELFAQFEKINSFKGTRIIIYNLKRDSTNRLEFDLTRDLYDVIIAEEYESTHLTDGGDVAKHTYSLRAYCSILFMKPKLRIYLRGKRVMTMLVEKSLSRTERDTYKPKNITLTPDKPVKITFGFNPKEENQYGILMYHRNRLIKPYVKVGCQTKPDQRGVGVIGVVECNFLDPTHNKQDFLDTNIYRRLIDALGNKLNDYWNEKMDVTPGNTNVSVTVNPENADQPDDNWVQCDRCQRWRKLPVQVNRKAVQKIKDWFCEMNPDPKHSKCGIEEEPEDTEEARPSYDKTFKKRTKTPVKRPVPCTIASILAEPVEAAKKPRKGLHADATVPIPIRSSPTHQPDDMIPKDMPSTSKASPSKPLGPSGLQRFETPTEERDSQKQELDMVEDLSKRSNRPSVKQLSDELEESWQKVEDLEIELKKVQEDASKQKTEMSQKAKEMEEWKAKTSQELKDANDSKDAAVKALEAAKQKHADQVKQVETECRKLLQVKEKEVVEVRQQHQDTQQDLTRKLTTAQNKWKDSERKVQERDAKLQSVRQQQANSQARLINLRAKVCELLKTLMDDGDLDNMVTDPHSNQVDSIVQQVIDDNSVRE